MRQPKQLYACGKTYPYGNFSDIFLSILPTIRCFSKEVVEIGPALKRTVNSLVPFQGGDSQWEYRCVQGVFQAPIAMTRLASGPTTAWPAPAHAATHGLKPPSCCLQLRIRDFHGICSLTTSPSRCLPSSMKYIYIYIYMPCLRKRR